MANVKNALQLLVVVAIAASASTLRAAILTPACPDLVALGQEIVPKQDVSINDVQSRLKVPAAFVGSRIATIFGKPALAWTPDDGSAAAKATLACSTAAKRARSTTDAQALKVLASSLRDFRSTLVTISMSERRIETYLGVLLKDSPSLATLDALVIAGSVRDGTAAAMERTEQDLKASSDRLGGWDPAHTHAKNLLKTMTGTPTASWDPVFPRIDSRIAEIRQVVGGALGSNVGTTPAKEMAPRAVASAPTSTVEALAPQAAATSQAEPVKVLPETPVTNAASAAQRGAVGTNSTSAPAGTDQPTVPTSPAPAASDDIAAQMAMMKQLFDNGLIDQEDFDRRSKALLDNAFGRVPVVAPPSSQVAAQTASGATKPTSDAAPAAANNLPDIDWGNYYALVIGINDYESLPKLQTAVSDAHQVADLLERNYGFTVTRLINPNHEALVDALDILRETLRGDDNLLIYYAGHGWLDEEADRGYWLPADAEPNRRSHWVSNTTLTDTLRTVLAKHVMVVADSCFSGTLTRAAKISLPTADYWKKISSKAARVTLTSGGLEPVADNNGKGNSPFAAAFIDALENNQGLMDGTSLFTAMRRPVMLNANQTPEYSDVRSAGHDGGDFVFVRR